MHDIMFAVASYIAWFAIACFLGGWSIGIVKWDLRYPAIGMLFTLFIIACACLYAVAYWLIGGTTMYPNG
jgi:hypothetical protein